MPSLAVGEPAPDFTLPSQDGSPVSLHDFQGKWVVLYFYPKDNTPGCSLEAHNFQRDLSKFESSDAIVLGVSLDSRESHEQFCTKQGLTFRLLSDNEAAVARRYGSLRNVIGFKMAARNTFLIDPKGRIAQIWMGVNPTGHSDEVYAALTGQIVANKK